jgi:uncharacterized protein (DUF1778 family)
MEQEKENIINLYVTADERKRLENAAVRSGLVLPAWIRLVALRAAEQEDDSSGEKEPIKPVVGP